MRSLKLTVAYDGTDYVGWQVQPNGPSIQSVLQKAWANVTGEQKSIVASGRTDAGVHAIGQVCSVNTSSRLDENALCRAINTHLPPDIVVTSIESAPDGFHAIADAIKKTYRYQIRTGWPKDIFQRRYVWQVKHQLDIDLMRQAARYIIGEHDFACFQAAGASTKTSVRNVLRLEIHEGQSRFEGTGENGAGQGTQNLQLEIEANGFLYNMVRNIVGTLVEIGSGKRDPNSIPSLIQSRDRTLAGPTAPPQGLFLVGVEYRNSSRAAS